jgi:octaprenyl-diphosphate synthase
MNPPSAAMTHFEQFKQFETELQAVDEMLVRAAEDLGSPLGDLVRAQVKQAQPLVRGAVVLTIAVAPDETLTNAPARAPRILLAAALEMLYVALNIHRLLVTAAMSQRPGSDDPLDRSFVGSTILAGDYCFSRAAQMAARTDHPQVVAIFAQALQNVSEGLLRSQFNPDPQDPRGDFDETRELLRSGADAAGTLVDLAESARQAAVGHSQEIAAQWTASRRTESAPAFPPFSLPTHGRWPLLQQWLVGQRSNGTPPANHTHKR